MENLPAQQGTSFDEMERAAEMMAESGLFPKWNTKAKMMSLMLLCRSEGSDPIAAVNRYDNIQGRISKKPIAMLEDFYAAGGDVEWHELSDERAEGTFAPPDCRSTLRVSYTIQEARKAKLVNKDNWRKYPADMLRNRLIGRALRAVHPVSTGRVYSPEETEDFREIGTGEGAKMFPEPKPETDAKGTESKHEAEVIAPESEEGLELTEKEFAFLVSINWLEEGQGEGHLVKTQVEYIKKRREAFAKKAKEFAERKDDETS